MFVQEIEPLAVYVNRKRTYVLQQQQFVDSKHIEESKRSMKSNVSLTGVD